MKLLKKAIIAILLVSLITPSITVHGATTSKNITMKNYVIMLVKASKVEVTSYSNDSYVQAAQSAGILTENEMSKLDKNLTRLDAIILGYRAEEILNGTSFDKALCKKITSKGRISDLKKITEGNRSAVIKMFSKGIYVGDSNGSYTQSRKINGNVNITENEAKAIVTRIKDKSKRRKLSPDGQVIRTTKLPKNYKDFPYILESLPNKFYETIFWYTNARKGDGSKLIEGKDYTRPVNMRKIMFNTELGYKNDEILDLYLDDWCKTVKTNLECRFNVDYRTIDNNWVTKLRSTYYVWEDDAYENKKKTDYIKDYVKFVKKHKIVIKSEKIVVEPSTVYCDSGEYIRTYVKFKVVSFEGKLTQDELFYCRSAYINNLKKGKTVEAIFDIGIGSKNGYSKGDDYAIFGNDLCTLK